MISLPTQKQQQQQMMDELEAVDALILPGGESTAMIYLLKAQIVVCFPRAKENDNNY